MTRVYALPRKGRKAGVIICLIGAVTQRGAVTSSKAHSKLLGVAETRTGLLGLGVSLIQSFPTSLLHWSFLGSVVPHPQVGAVSHPPTHRGGGGEAAGPDGALVCGSDSQGVAAMADFVVQFLSSTDDALGKIWREQGWIDG